ncbi:gliding motility-associated C-terminal domain-containing protein [Pontibacter harenae]|uniref:T9SS type B sorting domain-containing protein n=1 Tax=Pontibacter harenae TaxID=2894083 RepID=UPI001E3BFB6B|nr:gliding motility-associated C-terminal domain-containing protein [Pontibacter harenae]MCC9166600.1 gliding motility-associated C-terminal domain-containing protein [Pontibacter harenae]
MKQIFLLLLVCISLSAFALPNDGCFKVMQNGQEVEVICVGQPVSFVDCTSQNDPNTTIFYYPGPEAYSNQTNLLVRDEAHLFTEAGTHIVTQIINRTGSGETKLFSKTYEVKASPAPTFTAYSCANSRVQVNITDSNYNSYTLDYGDGNVNQVGKGKQPVYTYTSAGPYTITVTGNYTNSTCSNSSIQTIDALPPISAPRLSELRITSEAASGEIMLSTQNLAQGYIYIVERASNSQSNFTLVDTLDVTSTSGSNFTIPNVNTAEAALYRIRVTDRCSSTLYTSNTVSSLTLQATPGNELVRLDWQQISGYSSGLQLYRDGTLLQTLPNNVQTYTDTDVTCGRNYSYQISSTTSEGAVSLSAAKTASVTSTTIPPAPLLLSTFNLNNEVELTLQLPSNQTLKEVSLQRSMNGGNYGPLATFQQPHYTDNLANFAPVCYRASYTNTCDNTSTYSSPTCPVILQATKPDEASVNLTWSDYEGFADGVREYTVEVLDQNNDLIASYPATGNAYTDRVLSEEELILRYRIKATSNSNLVSYSNLQTIEQSLRLYVPSAFTPNNDGLNDTFKVKGRFFEDFNIKIYSRIGIVVYSSTDATAGWDGTLEGKLLPAGAYVYEINVKVANGTPKLRTGTVTLLR